MDLHTVHHGKNESGRAYTIEKYIEASVDFALSKVQAESIVDLGCDYGYAVHYSKNSKNITGFGCDLYHTHNPFNLTIHRESLEDPLLMSKLQPSLNSLGNNKKLWFINHVIEHLYNPYVLLSSINQVRSKDDSLFLAVPHCDSDWATWEGHYSIWNENWLIHFAKLNKWDLIDIKTTELREGHVEIWGIFK